MRHINNILQRHREILGNEKVMVPPKTRNQLSSPSLNLPQGKAVSWEPLEVPETVGIKAEPMALPDNFSYVNLVEENSTTLIPEDLEKEKRIKWRTFSQNMEVM